jgi:hypothetical protein
MRLALVLAIALWLSLSAAATTRLQDPASNSPGQAPAPPAAPAEKPAADATPTPEEKAPESAADSASNSKDKPGPTSLPPIAAPIYGNSKRRKRAAPPPEDRPKKVVVRQGGTSEPAAQIAPGMTPAEALRQRQNAEQLLAATDDQLQMLAAGPVDARRQETMGQIRNYIVHARSALKEGDLRRANTLAEKAHLLSDDLVEH